jgi:nucleoid-associated protein YgaU
MPRLAHGESLSLEQLQDAQRDLASYAAENDLGFLAARVAVPERFDLLFLDLQRDPANLLPKSANTVKHLKALGGTMHDPGDGGDPGNAEIPAIYTYFGQFIDHDISLELSTFPDEKIVANDLKPLELAEIRALTNARTATLELDSVYEPPAVRDGKKMRIGHVTKVGGRPPGKGDDNDLHRQPPSDNIRTDRAALIGDPRNDENLIVSQLHLAFLKAHNRWVDQGRSFEEAQRLLRQHYQHLVIHDFLNRIADPAIVKRILTQGNKVFHALEEPFFLPLEFSAAAYRFGHSMVRDNYDFNLNFNPASLGLLFTFTALSGELGGSKTLPENWIIQWERFVKDDTKNKARRIDTKLAGGLFHLQNLEGEDLAGQEPKDFGRLAVRNLLRGYGLRLPTGQAVAGRLHLPVLTANQIKNAAASPKQAEILGQAGFLERTPLWYYLLAEAKHHGGQRLGPVGSTIVAEVLIGLVRRSKPSILNTPGWVPSIPTTQPGRFELADLLRFAKVLGGGPPPRTYTVKANDTLSTIAKKQLGNANRWPEIFVLNRAKIRHRDIILPGQVFTLPGDTPIQPRPRLYKVKAGDTLSEIAKKELGKANRWPEIAQLNRDIITHPPDIKTGWELVILPT